MQNMGMHKMGQHQDIHLPKTLGGFMNPTMSYANGGGMLQQDVVRKKHKKHARKLAGMGMKHMKKKLVGMGMKHMKKKLVGMGMGMMMRAAVKGGNRKPDHVHAHKAHKAHKKTHMGMMGHKLLSRGAWALVKKTNGQCECTQSPNGQIVVGRFHSRKECEDGRGHGC